jgi:hypothetical protein
MRLDVVNPGGRDAPVDFRGGVTPPGAPGHPPVNYWAYAAATAGRFHREVNVADITADAVLVLIRQRVGVSLAAVRKLKRAGRTVFVSWKETGASQIAQQLRWFWRRGALRRLLAEADGAIAVTEHAAEHYREMGCRNIAFLPTPYPVDVPAWDFSARERRGIFIGTREFDVPGRRHDQALELAAHCARAAKVPVSVMNFDGPKARKRIESLLAGVAGVNILEQKLDYPAYLREMARHRLVLQLDESQVPGQVAGDALLCRTLAVGGNGTIQRVACAPFALTDPVALQPLVQRLLGDDAFYDSAVAASQKIAAEKLSFAACRAALRRLVPARA